VRRCRGDGPRRAIASRWDALPYPLCPAKP
jgi:hypothetical protein